MKLIIVRHGLTTENEHGICQGQTEGTLSAKGVLANEQLSLILKNISIDAFYSSILNRAKQTLDQLKRYHKDTPYLFDPRLNEWGMGILEGKVFPKNYDFTEDINIEGLERFDAVKRRCTSFLDEIRLNHLKKTVLVVSHGLTIRMMESILLETDFDKTKLLENSSQKTFRL